MNIIEVKPVLKDIIKKVNNAAFQEAWGIDVGNNVGKVGTENTFDYAIEILRLNSRHLM
jgi:hypothetical protein